jgi:predicted RNA-binding protein associated with RNAse of E/G family
MEICTQRKHYLSGEEVTFACELVDLQDGFGILKYMVPQQLRFQNLVVPQGSISYGFFWTDRPYNLYMWVGEHEDVLGCYFNVADAVSLSRQEFVWTDLVVDILIVPGPEHENAQARVQLLDEDQVPETLDEAVRATIYLGKCEVLRNHRAIIEEARAALAHLRR